MWFKDRRPHDEFSIFLLPLPPALDASKRGAVSDAEEVVDVSAGGSAGLAADSDGGSGGSNAPHSIFDDLTHLAAGTSSSSVTASEIFAAFAPPFSSASSPPSSSPPPPSSSALLPSTSPPALLPLTQCHDFHCLFPQAFATYQNEATATIKARQASTSRMADVDTVAVSPSSAAMHLPSLSLSPSIPPSSSPLTSVSAFNSSCSTYLRYSTSEEQTWPAGSFGVIICSLLLVVHLSASFL